MTVTPTLQEGAFFLRGGLSDALFNDSRPSLAFGKGGNVKNQPVRGMVEFGFLS